MHSKTTLKLIGTKQSIDYFFKLFLFSKHFFLRIQYLKATCCTVVDR